MDLQKCFLVTLAAVDTGMNRLVMVSFTVFMVNVKSGPRDPGCPLTSRYWMAAAYSPWNPDVTADVDVMVMPVRAADCGMPAFSDTSVLKAYRWITSIPFVKMMLPVGGDCQRGGTECVPPCI